MPSFDIASEVDVQKLDNTINVVKKEILNRYDFKDSQTSIEFDKKELLITVATENPMGINAIEDVLITRAVKQGIDGRAFDFSKEEVQSGKLLKKTIKVRSGLGKEDSKKVVKIIKDSGLKVQASIMDEMVRVTGKKIDDLQSVIALLKGSNLDLPLQFINMKS